jgi:hypothetical protein
MTDSTGTLVAAAYAELLAQLLRTVSQQSIAMYAVTGTC